MQKQKIDPTKPLKVFLNVGTVRHSSTPLIYLVYVMSMRSDRACLVSGSVSAIKDLAHHKAFFFSLLLHQSLACNRMYRKISQGHGCIDENIGSQNEHDRTLVGRVYERLRGQIYPVVDALTSTKPSKFGFHISEVNYPWIFLEHLYSRSTHAMQSLMNLHSVSWQICCIHTRRKWKFADLPFLFFVPCKYPPAYIAN